jgi:hypothetical protein
MPSRLIREGILTSERVEQLDCPAEVFYRRLMSKVDDHGLYDARPSVLRASLYPLRIDRVREADISRWIAACEKAGLIALYVHHSKPYLQMLDTRWTARSEPKFPIPPANGCGEPETPENNCAQLKTGVSLDVGVVLVEDVGEKPRARKSRKSAETDMPDDFDISERVARWATEKGHTRLREHLEAFKSKVRAKGYRYVDWDEAFMNAIRGDWAQLKNAHNQPIAGSGAHRPFPPEEKRVRRDPSAGAPAEFKELASKLGIRSES